MHTVHALLCFVVLWYWLILCISVLASGLLHWHWGNHTIAPVPVKQPWRIWINKSWESKRTGDITTWCFYPYPSGLLHWHWGNHMIAPVPVKQPWRIWVKTSWESKRTGDITTMEQSITNFACFIVHNAHCPENLSNQDANFVFTGGPRGYHNLHTTSDD